VGIGWRGGAPRDVVKAVADGSIDVAIVWGPFAGYFAKPFGNRLVVRPAPVEPALPTNPSSGISPRQYDATMKPYRSSWTAAFNVSP